ncbi:MAG: glucose-6-phosphate isomerase [Gammaproteobacteria bacterium]|nr:glucose-6-phosphate isomerase [Gammaproteobacteria bacterium]
MSKLTTSASWQALQEHFKQIHGTHMRQLFAEDPKRFARFSLQLDDLLLDYSKNRITPTTLDLLLQLAHECDVPKWIERMFNGDIINHTEHRAVLHIALRNRANRPIQVQGQDVMPDVNAMLGKIRGFTEQVRNGHWLGYSQQRITDVVNIGVGGSDLGPVMATEALRPYASRDLHVHFVSNVDENHITDVLESLDPQTTLFIIVSKTFTTQETLTNAETAREWFLAQHPDTAAIAKHFVAVSDNVKAASEFGIDPDNLFKMWDWVGGRYSLWSAVGLSIACAVGMDNFEQLLEGAHDMDEHFRTAPLEQNMPVILGLLGVWYSNFFNAQTYAVLPYDQHLRFLPDYLRQADMESNGKSVDREGKPVDYSTGPIVFGSVGISGQHAFYQLMHQGTPLIPADLLAAAVNLKPLRKHHEILMANVFAQAEAFMRGKTEKEARAELQAQGLTGDALENLLPYKVFAGNKPTNLLLFHTLNPRTLGRLVALYEHKIFVQGVIWNINSFDQWGVELGKQLAKTVLGELQGDASVSSHDCSTNGLINYYKKLRKD